MLYNNFFLKWTRRFSWEFRGSRFIRLSRNKSTSWVSLFNIAPGTFSSDPKALLFSPRGKRETRVTREWLVTKRKGLNLGRTKMRAKALSGPFSPSRLPLSGNFHRGRRCLGIRQAQNPCEAFQWEANPWSGGPSSLFLLYGPQTFALPAGTPDSYC